MASSYRGRAGSSTGTPREGTASAVGVERAVPMMGGMSMDRATSVQAALSGLKVKLSLSNSGKVRRGAYHARATAADPDLAEPFIPPADRNSALSIAHHRPDRRFHPTTRQLFPSRAKHKLRIPRARTPINTASAETAPEAAKRRQSGLFDRQARHAECAVDDVLERRRALLEGFRRGGVGHARFQGGSARRAKTFCLAVADPRYSPRTWSRF